MTAPDIRFFTDPLGNNIAYATQGEGPLVVCPPWWISHVEKDWEYAPFQQFFLRLGRGLRVVRYDRPGVGLSDRADVAGRTLADETNLLSALVDELGESELSLFGVSCGGPPALALAAQRQSQIAKMCLYGSFACGNDLGSGEIRDAVLSTVRAHWGMGSRAMADLFVPDEPRQTHDTLAAQQREWASVEAASHLLELTYAMDARPYLKQVQSETLVIHRRGDRAIPLEAARVLAAGTANARLVTLQGSAHPPWLGGSDVAETANAFFTGHVDAARTAAPADDGGCRFDRDNRCMLIGGEKVSLTALEFAVLVALTDAEGSVVTRDYLLQRIWRQPFDGSNRVNSLIRGLRRKLGDYAPSIETAIGHGYRFNGWTNRG